MGTADDNDEVRIGEAALHAALNVLRDSVDCGCMPSGLPLEPAIRDRHEHAIHYLDTLLRQIQAIRREASQRH